MLAHSDLVWVALYERDHGAEMLAAASQDARSGCGFWAKRYVADFFQIDVFEAVPGSSAELQRRFRAACPYGRLVLHNTAKLESARLLGDSVVLGADLIRQACKKTLRYVQFVECEAGMCPGFRVEASAPLHMTSHAAVVACLPPAAPRYGILICDQRYLLRNGATLHGARAVPKKPPEEKTAFLWVIWIPEACTVRQKLTYASQFALLQNVIKLPIAAELQATCYDEVSIDAVASKFEFLFPSACRIM